MSTGGSGSFGSLGRASVDVTADLSSYDAAMASLPGKARAKIADAMQAIQAEMARTRLEIKSVSSVDVSGGGLKSQLVAAEVARLNEAYGQLAAKATATQSAAIGQAQALQKVAAASREAADAARQQAQAEKEVARAAAASMKADSKSAAIQAKTEATAAAKQQAQAEASLAQQIKSVTAETMKQAQAARVVADASKAQARAQAQAWAEESASTQRFLRRGAAGSGVSPVAGGGSPGARGGNGPAGAIDDIGRAGSNAGYKLQILAQGLDDLQYVGEQGMRPILNNLIQFSPIIGIAGLALEQFIRHAGDLTKMFGTGALKTEAQQLEELAKKYSKLSDEVERLNRASLLKETLADQAGKRSSTQNEQASRVNAAVAEAVGSGGFLSGRENLATSLAVINREKYESYDPRIAAQRRLIEERDQLARTPDQKKAAAVENAKAEADIHARTLEVARRDLANAAIDPGRLGSMLEQMNKNPHLFDDKTRLAFSEALPSNIEAEKSPEIHGGEPGAKSPEARARIDRDATEAASAFMQRIAPSILEKMARGQPIDRDKLNAAIEPHLKAAGYQNAAEVAKVVTNRAIGDIEGNVRARQLRGGGPPAEAARAELADRISALKSEVDRNRPSAGVTDFASFRNEAQDAIFKGKANDALVNEMERLRAVYEDSNKIQTNLNETIKGKDFGNGPPILKR